MWSSPPGKSSNAVQRDSAPADDSRRVSGSSAVPSIKSNADIVPDTKGQTQAAPEDSLLEVHPKPYERDNQTQFPTTPPPESIAAPPEQREYELPDDDNENQSQPSTSKDQSANRTNSGVFGKLKALAGLKQDSAPTQTVKDEGEDVGKADQVVGDTVGNLDQVSTQDKDIPASASSVIAPSQEEIDEAPQIKQGIIAQDEIIPKSTVADSIETPSQDAVDENGLKESLSEVQDTDFDPKAETFEEVEDDLPPLSTLEGLTCNKMGKVISPSTGKPIGELVEGDPKKLSRLGSKLDNKGQFWDSRGNVVGKARTIRFEDYAEEPPFAGIEGLHVVENGFVEDKSGRKVGKISEGDAVKLIGRSVDEDGDIIDNFGSVKGHAEPYQEPEEEQPEEVDLSILEGKIVNKAGNVVDEHGKVYGRITSGDKRLAGRTVDSKGQIWGDTGTVIGKAELIPNTEQEKPEGPFFGFQPAVVGKDGYVFDSSSHIIGRVIDGDAIRLAGRNVDEDGDVLDKMGNVIGRAERWEPEEKKRNVNPMSGRKVTREGEVRDVDGNLIGKLTSGNLATLVGKEIDDNGYVVDNDGNKIGECTLLENIVEPEPEPEPEPEVEEEAPGPSPEELEAQRKAEIDRDLAKKMVIIVGQTLDRVSPICKMITEHIDKADRTPRDELDEEQLVQNVKPLLEEGGTLLQECNGAIRALDPDGHIAAAAKARAASHEASPEEYALADKLKELTDKVVTTIESSKRKIADMPHAKKELNPLWMLMSEPLFQIIAAVGLLLTGVLGLVGRLLEGLGLGPLVHGLLGGLGIDKLLGSLGLTSLTDALGLTGKKK